MCIGIVLVHNFPDAEMRFYRTSNVMVNIDQAKLITIRKTKALIQAFIPPWDGFTDIGRLHSHHG